MCDDFRIYMKKMNVCQPIQYLLLLLGWGFLNVTNRAIDIVPVGLFIQNDVNNYSQHLVLLPSLIMSSWNLPLQWARIFTFTLEELILYLKMPKSISPRRAIGQVQKFVGRRIIISLEITVRESIHVFSHSLILIHISCYIINLSTSMLPFSSHFTSGQS